MPVKLVHNLTTPPRNFFSRDFDNMSLDEDLKATKKILSKMEGEASKMRKKIIEAEKLKVRRMLNRRPVLISDDEECSDTSILCTDDFDVGMAMRYKGDLDLKCGMLREQLSLQAHDLKTYRDKVLKLQDQLIQKNELEKRMLRKQHKPVTTCDLEKQLEAKVAKVRSLEEAYRKQEKVIEKMEMLLRMQSISKAKRTERRMEELEKENSLLRKRLIELKDDCCTPCPYSLPRQSPQSLDHSNQPHQPHQGHPPQISHTHHLHHQPSRKQQHQGKPLPVDSFQDYLEMKEKFHQAEARIKRLEEQIVENQQEWMSEKTKLMNLLKSNKDGDGFCLCTRMKCVGPSRRLPQDCDEPLRNFDFEENSSIRPHHLPTDNHHHHHHYPEDHHQQQHQTYDYYRNQDDHRRRRQQLLFQQSSRQLSSPLFACNSSNDLQGHVRQQQPFLSPRRFEQH